ncbi:prolyl 4-hydroxylase 1-like [Pomacea canaliculata]|nr:prolyl 4-hydroxylase 1-like [Pomacea canaliculata]
MANISAAIKKEDLQLPSDQNQRLAFVLHNVLSPEECKQYISQTEEKGYVKALLNIGGGKELLMTDVRNSDRCIIDSVEEALKVWQRIKEYIPQEWDGRAVIGLNERLRFLRYDPGQYFKPHMDGCYSRENGEMSFITIQIYLNDGFEGGSTTFMSLDGRQRLEVVPKAGSVLVFQHNIYHEGSVLKEGRKYSVRTDVMYSPPS